MQFGEYGLKALERGWITNRQIEAARIAMTRKIKRGGKVWINIFPDKPVTKKPAETRMGSGKGNPEGWVAVVKPGRVMFELAGVPEPLAREAMRLAGHKLPVKTKFVDARGESGLMAKADEMRELDDDAAASSTSATRARSCSACASSTPPASWRTPPGLRDAKRDLARALTVARERDRRRGRSGDSIPTRLNRRARVTETDAETTPEERRRGEAAPEAPAAEARRGARRARRSSSRPKERRRRRKRAAAPARPARRAPPRSGRPSAEERRAQGRRAPARLPRPAPRPRRAERRAAPPPPRRRRAAPATAHGRAARCARASSSPTRPTRRSPSASTWRAATARYEKIVRSSSTLHAHDERNEANVGDTVRVIESRPLSRTKRWRLVEVLERAR